MKLWWHQSTWENATRVNMILSITSLILAAIAFYLVIGSQSKHERIILMPMSITQQMSIDWSSADESYIKAYALSVAGLVGNLTPQNANFVIDALSRNIDSSIYADLRKKMLAITITRQFKELSVSTRYLPDSVELEKKTGKVFVSGYMETKTTTGTDARPMTYEMQIKIKEGMPFIYSFDNYPGSAHNNDWISANPVSGVPSAK